MRRLPIFKTASGKTIAFEENEVSIRLGGSQIHSKLLSADGTWNNSFIVGFAGLDTALIEKFNSAIDVIINKNLQPQNNKITLKKKQVIATRGAIVKIALIEEEVPVQHTRQSATKLVNSFKNT